MAVTKVIQVAGSRTAEHGKVAEYYGLSSDEKPARAGNGDVFWEMDTKKLFLFDGENGLWREQ